MGSISIRRLSDATLKKYQDIVDSGGTLTPRQQRALEGHRMITNDAIVALLLGKSQAPQTKANDEDRARVDRARVDRDDAD